MLYLPAEQGLGSSHILFNFLVVLPGWSVSVEKCPEKEFFEVVSLDLTGGCSQEPLVEIGLWITNIVVAQFKKFLSLCAWWCWGMQCFTLQLLSVYDIDQDVEDGLGDSPDLEGQGSTERSQKSDGRRKIPDQTVEDTQRRNALKTDDACSNQDV